MADVKISALPTATDTADDDVLPIVDTSTTTTKQLAVLAFRKQSQPLKYVNKTADYTLQLTDNVIVVDSSSGAVTITLPAASTIPDDGCIHEYYIWQKSGSNAVTVSLSGADTFPQGHNKIVLEGIGGLAHIGGMRDKWGNMELEEVAVQARRNTSWDASNFSTYSAISFNLTDSETNDSAIKHDDSNTSRILCKVAGAYTFSADACFSSTGGGYWNTTIKVRLNGSTDIAGSEVSTGNYGGEDNSAHITNRRIILEADDYLELFVEHSGLVGSLSDAVFNVRTTA